MNRIHALLLAGALLLGAANALAQSAASSPPGSEPSASAHAQPMTRIRGTITGFDGQELQVKTRDGKALKLRVSDTAKINVLSPLKMSDIKVGSFVGITAVLRGGDLQALEVHVFPEAMRGTGEGHYDWDLTPGSTMTNANVDAIVATNNGEQLTLTYKGGRKEIIVPKNIPIITFTPADKALLKSGAQVFIIAQPAADGSLAALRILIGQAGMKPPM